VLCALTVCSAFSHCPFSHHTGAARHNCQSSSLGSFTSQV
jgi:hypothetical protein